MSPPQQTQFQLLPYPGSAHPGVENLEGSLSRAGPNLQIRYELSAELGRLQLPPRQTPSFADELWRHTCFELFLAIRGETGYVEFNFSPSGHWACYAFSAYREGLSAVKDATPRMELNRSADLLELTVSIPLDRLDPGKPLSTAGRPEPQQAGRGLGYRRGPLVLAVCAVLESAEPQADPISYWALRHPAAKPDFHHPDAFALELDAIRN